MRSTSDCTVESRRGPEYLPGTQTIVIGDRQAEIHVQLEPTHTRGLTMRNASIGRGICLALYFLIAARSPNARGSESDLERSLAAEIQQFSKVDDVQRPMPCQVEFVGSSTIVRWSETLAKDMAPIPVFDRGFGGSQIEHINRWFDQVVRPYHPSAIVFYAGDNDIDAGKSVERVLGDFDRFMDLKSASLGKTPVYFVSIKPSKLRQSQMTLQRQVNEAVRQRSTIRMDLRFVDVVSPMMENGTLKDVFEPDGLHMTRAGYAIWTPVIKDALLRDYNSRLQQCAQTLASQAAPAREDLEGTLHLPEFSLPESSFLRAETRAALKAARESNSDDLSYWKNLSPWKACPSIATATNVEAPAIHQCQADAFAASPFFMHLRDRYAVAIRPEEIGGVHTERFVPAQGIAPGNRNRVLINVHGGGFLGGWGTLSMLESLPIASVARIQVISVDYRKGPENEFPAATEDVVTVYRELLKTYKPKNIGIYGCSAGGLLTAETIAWIQKEGLPPPGAIAMLCTGASYWSEGDSGFFGRAMGGTNLFLESSDKNPYFRHTKPDDPLAFPAYSPSTIAKFPPSLLISGTRDFGLSSVVHTHSLLVAHGVEAELHVWEGLGHAFIYDDSDLPESREVFSTLSRFFDRHLGR